MTECFRNNIKVYPIFTVVGWKIQVSINNKITTYNKVLNTNKEKNEAITKTYIHLANKY